MEGVLKGLNSASLTKKGLFDFLADLDLNHLQQKESVSKNIINKNEQEEKQKTRETVLVKNGDKEDDVIEIIYNIKENRLDKIVGKKYNNPYKNVTMPMKSIDEKNNENENENDNDNNKIIDNATYELEEKIKENIQENNSIKKETIPLPDRTIKAGDSGEVHTGINDNDIDKEESNTIEDVDDYDEFDTLVDRIETKKEKVDFDDILKSVSIIFNRNKKTRKNKEKSEFKCKVCKQTFVVKYKLDQHYRKSPSCQSLINAPQKPAMIQALTKGVHLMIIDILEQATTNNGKLQCKFCKTTFINKGNQHKHLNTAKMCNQLAFQEFKRLVNDL